MTLCALPFAPVTKFGTAIAAIRTPSEVVIAADSRVVDGYGRQMPDQCKIQVVVGSVYTAHGMSTHSATGFDLFALVSEVLRRPGSLESHVTTVSKSVSAALSAALLDMRQTAPIAFKRAISGAATGVIIARYEAGSPHLLSIRFIVHAGPGKQSKIEPEVRVCPGPDCPEGVAAVWVTPSEDKLAFQRANPDFWRTELTKVAAGFVEGEIAKGFPDVGPPIDIVRITSGGITWIQRQKSCEMSTG